MVDAVEIQLGQGAFGGAAKIKTQGDTIDEHLRAAWRLNEGEDSTIEPRFPQITNSNDIVNLVNEIKGKVDVPVGVKIAGTDYIEYDLAVIAKTKADYIVVDGTEGGTAGAPPTLEDNVGLPTLHSLVRTIDWLESNNIRNKFSVIASGGLATPGDFLKTLAIGADAVYIGSIALMATLQTQMAKALPQHPPPQLALYSGKLKDELDVDEAAKDLSNFLKSCVAEMQACVQVLGKSSIKDLDRSDMVSLDKELAEFIGIRYAASRRQIVTNEFTEVGSLN